MNFLLATRFFKSDDYTSFWGDSFYGGGGRYYPMKHFPGVKGLAPLHIAAKRFIVLFTTYDTSVGDWGYKMTIQPFSGLQVCDECIL